MTSPTAPAVRKDTTEKLWFVFLLALFFMTCLCGGLWGNTGSGSFSVAGITVTAGRFILVYSAIWMSLLLIFFYFPLQGFSKKNILMILAIALVARGLIFFQLPSDDVYRYIWEGMLFSNGVNPYLISPGDLSLAGFAKEFPYHSLINHPDIAAAYPPLMIGFFSLISTVSIELSAIKAVMALFDLGGLLFLISILKNRGVDIRWSLLYALNPLILYSFAGEGHFDSIQTFFLLGAIFFYDRKNWPMLFLFAGLAVQVKYVAVIGLPFLINRGNLKWTPVILLPVILPFIPFISDDPLAIFNGLRQFEGEFAFNGSVHSIFRILSGEIGTATVICRTLFIVLMLLGIVKLNNLINAKNKQSETDPVIGIFYAFAVLILIAPTIHLWYLTWILPFAVIRNRISWIVLSLTACLYFTAKSSAWFGGLWEMPIGAQIIEWSVFYIFFGFELYYLLINKVTIDDTATESVAVIIPVLDEEKKIAGCIRSIQKDPSVTEIIVVDGGSKDDTVAAAEAAGARVLVNNRPIENGGGRGGQIASGINAVVSDIVAVVHSDVIIHSNVFSKIKKLLELNRDVSGGAVGTKFEPSSFRTKFIEFLNGLRVVFFGISFGDQIQFFRRQVVVDNQLFPDIPLMEDIEFSLRLPKAGRRIFLFGDATVSSRRWETKGTSNFFMVLHLFFVYLTQRIFKMPDVVIMYRKYYK